MEENSLKPHETMNQLRDMNLEITYFLKKFTKFQETNVVDSTLCANFGKLIGSIESYLDSDPIEMASGDFIDFDIDFDAQQLQREFYCKLCDMTVNNSLAAVNKHLKKPKHMAAHRMMLNGDWNPDQQSGQRKGKNGFMDGDASVQAGLRKKINEENRARRKEKNKQFAEKKPLPKKMAAYVKSNFYNYLIDASNSALKLLQIPAYDELRTTLVNVIGQVYPNVRVYFFGSRISGLGNVDSDLDIYIDIGNNYNKYSNGENVTKIIKAVHKLLGDKPTEWRSFRDIVSARIPILRVYNQKLRIDCDINFSNSLGECNTLLAKYLILLQPLCQKMCLFVKRWIRLSAVSDRFSTYTLVLVVIFHLQRQRLLPSVQSLQVDIEPNLIGPWQGNFAPTDLSRLGIEKMPDTPDNLLKQLISFFSFCADFDYKNTVMCPYTGGPIDKTNFDNLNTVPSYDRYRETCSPNDIFQLTAMCVQDPMELNHNVAKGINDHTLNMFVNCCKLTATELKSRVGNAAVIATKKTLPE